MNGNRTDLAAEELPQSGGELPGVKSSVTEQDGFQITDVEILSEQGANRLCKPIGRYVTMDLTAFSSGRRTPFLTRSCFWPAVSNSCCPWRKTL